MPVKKDHKSPKKSVKSFSEWIRGLNHFDGAEAKARIIRECKLELKNGRCYKLQNWIDGKTKVEPLYQQIIVRIAGTPLRFNSMKEIVLPEVAPM